MRTAGLFLTHLWSDRIERHFRRLSSESGDSVAWHVVIDQGEAGHVCKSLSGVHPRDVLPSRFEQMQRNGGVQRGFMDVAIWPWLLAPDAEFIWVMEYDVDYSGNWAKLFGQFRSNPADLLATTLVPRSDSADWYWWRTASAPEHVHRNTMYRAFLPLMRISREFAHRYADSVADPAWAGHYEFTIPTAAVSTGLRVEDIGGHGRLCPAWRRNANYRNSSTHWELSPGTFVWRPSRERYYVESPEDFPETDLLYHPVKAGVAEWEKRRNSDDA